MIKYLYILFLWLFVVPYAWCQSLTGRIALRKDIGTFKLMTYNVRNCRGMDNITDYSRVAGIIKKIGADVIALQELDSATTRSNMSVVLNELAAVTGLYPAYRASIPFQGGKYGIGILSKDKPLNVSGISLPGREESRSLLVVEFDTYVVCCTHLSLTLEDRIAAMKLINKLCKKYSKPVFLGGDLNAEPTSPELQLLRKKWDQLNNSEQFTFPANDPVKCIDYILLRKNRKVKVENVASKVENEPLASDHLPVWVEIQMKLK